MTKKIPAVKEFYKAQGADLTEIFDKYKHIIEKEFIEGKTRGNPKVRFSVARKAINDFKRVTGDATLIADLLLVYAESVSHFSAAYSPSGEKFYDLPEELFEKVLSMARRGGFLEKFADRAYELVENACDGYGHQESLKDTYVEYYGEFIQ